MEYEIREVVRLLNCSKPILTYEIRYMGVVVYVESCPERARSFIRNKLKNKCNENGIIKESSV